MHMHTGNTILKIGWAPRLVIGMTTWPSIGLALQSFIPTSTVTMTNVTYYSLVRHGTVL